MLLLDGDAVAEAYRIAGTPGVIVVDGKRVVHFDLRRLPPLAPPANASVKSHSGKAAYLAPYWASEIRKSIDAVLDNST
jgi:hypothetical protein